MEEFYEYDQGEGFQGVGARAAALDGTPADAAATAVSIGARVRPRTSPALLVAQLLADECRVRAARAGRENAVDGQGEPRPVRRPELRGRPLPPTRRS